MNRFDWDHGFSVDFDTITGLSKTAQPTRRKLSQMKEMYLDVEAAEEILKNDDPVVYDFYELGHPERYGDLAFGTTILYPGKVGSEYFMTKGHFHTIVDTSEVYYALSGEGYMVMENIQGDTITKPIRKNEAVYVPRGYAHRSVNTGDEPLVMFFVYHAEAGHDYGTIETKGYRKLVTEKDGEICVMDNPKWSES